MGGVTSYFEINSESSKDSKEATLLRSEANAQEFKVKGFPPAAMTKKLAIPKLRKVSVASLQLRS